jgi:tetraacyldisaccharide 4'-kinase
MSADRPAEAPDGVMERVWARRGWIGAVLGPVLAVPEVAFRGVVALRDIGYRIGLLPSRPSPVPAISVGNLTVGGTGKTPVVRWLTDALRARGHRPGILHGGYADDEPALHRRWFPELPVVADRDRVRGARAAAEAGADVVVLDDAFQHRRIRRDLDLVLVSAEGWTPRPRLLPRGPFREPLRALRRADVVVVTRRRGSPEEAAAVARSVHRRTGGPVAVAHLHPTGWLKADGEPREGTPPPGVGVAGIGRPTAFFDQVAARGARLEARLAFRDHHDYNQADAARIRAAAGEGAVITTAKDAVKLGPLLGGADVWVLDQGVAFDQGGDAVLAAVEAAIR